MSQTDTSHNAGVDHLQKLHRRRMSLFGMVILIAGIAIGAASILILAPGEVMPPGIAFDRFSMPLLMSMERDLHLSPEQKEEIQPIISTHMERISDIHEDVQDQVSEQWTQMNDLIFAALTEEQQEIWERRLEDVQRRLRDGGRQGGPWRSGGPGSHYRRGPGDSDRYRKGPGSFGPGRPGGLAPPPGPGIRIGLATVSGRTHPRTAIAEVRARLAPVGERTTRIGRETALIATRCRIAREEGPFRMARASDDTRPARIPRETTQIKPQE